MTERFRVSTTDSDISFFTVIVHRDLDPYAVVTPTVRTHSIFFSLSVQSVEPPSRSIHLFQSVESSVTTGCHRTKHTRSVQWNFRSVQWSFDRECIQTAVRITKQQATPRSHKFYPYNIYRKRENERTLCKEENAMPRTDGIFGMVGRKAMIN